MTTNPIPTLKDVLAARPHVYQYIKPTPLHYYPTLSDLLGANIYIKHENHLPIGVFKLRGGLVLAAHLTSAERQAGLFTASTGNHGQSIAYAAQVHGLQATIAMPENANPDKVASMRALGANVQFHGQNFDSAREWIVGVAEEKHGRFVSPTEETLIHGVGTYALEILEDLPEVDTIIVPVGAGSGVCATAIVAKSINPHIEIIAVQSEAAPAMQKSWAAGEMISAQMNSFAEGIATSVPFASTQAIMRQYLDDFVLVSEEAIKEAVRLLWQHTHNMPEGAGAASTAAAMTYKERFAGKNVVLVMSGGNLSTAKLQMIFGKGLSN